MFIVLIDWVLILPFSIASFVLFLIGAVNCSVNKRYFFYITWFPYYFCFLGLIHHRLLSKLLKKFKLACILYQITYQMILFHINPFIFRIINNFSYFGFAFTFNFLLYKLLAVPMRVFTLIRLWKFANTSCSWIIILILIDYWQHVLFLIWGLCHMLMDILLKLSCSLHLCFKLRTIYSLMRHYVVHLTRQIVYLMLTTSVLVCNRRRASLIGSLLVITFIYYIRILLNYSLSSIITFLYKLFRRCIIWPTAVVLLSVGATNWILRPSHFRIHPRIYLVKLMFLLFLLLTS